MIPDRPYTDDDLAAVSDNPEWTAEDFREARPFRDVFPDLVGDGEQAGREAVQVYIDRDIVELFRAGGPDWESRLNRRLREAIDPAS